MARIIVFSGHGQWALGKDGFFTLPIGCTMKFYTCNMKTLSDGLGGDIDRGIIAGLEPDQEATELQRVPDMRLFPPEGLTIKQPGAGWHVVKLPAAIPNDQKNLQIQIDDAYPGGGSLSEMFEFLKTAIKLSGGADFLWAACRAINLRKAGGAKFGVNVMQR
jgi:hypothetical protein